MVVEDDQAAGGGLQLLDQSTVTGARWVDVQGCCGVHGVASLCGGRVRANINHWFTKVNAFVFTGRKGLVCGGYFLHFVEKLMTAYI